MSDNTSILSQLKYMISILENSLVDAEKLVHKHNYTAGKRVRKNMQDLRKYSKDVRTLVQDFKRENDNQSI